MMQINGTLGGFFNFHNNEITYVVNMLSDLLSHKRYKSETYIGGFSEETLEIMKNELDNLSKCGEKIKLIDYLLSKDITEKEFLEKYNN